ncbi:MAG TPA: DUF1254 domain-containing protein [Candidatus Limnocylindria bacterium]|jgi:hypothetical protein|nr:DUF1254 domain-containing protein [Candidatus Limnocylindria bacterium]
MAAGTETKAATAVDELRTIATEGYVYFYPLVTMDVTRRVATNVPAGQSVARGPANAFTHLRTFPPPTMRDVVRPNFDTLYSVAWLDLTAEPVLLTVPDTGGRYYLLPMLDMWTDVFASPGKRTTGTSKHTFAVVPPRWNGSLPDGTIRIDAPTPFVWVIGRTQTNGASDYAAVNRIQDGMLVTPLSQFGRPAVPPTVAIDPSVDMTTPPLHQVNAMSARDFFTRAVDVMKVNPPHIVDEPILARLERLGIVAGAAFDFERAAPAVKTALEQATKDGLATIREKVPTLARSVNHWQMNTDTVGVYGTYYLKRACIAMFGLGANLPEDAIYPLNLGDSAGEPLDGSRSYVLHFTGDQLPPVDAFWSVTLYDPDGFPVPNGLNRNAIGDRDPLTYNADGSLDLFVQRISPGRDKEANWIPAPTGPFNLLLRLYAPRASVTRGAWAPPPVMRISG